MRRLLDFALAQTPGLYAEILKRRPRRNVEKLVFLAVVERGDVVFDVGANLGYYTLLFSHLAGRRGRVHAFEPIPETLAALEAGLARERRFDNVTLNEWALSDRTGSLPFFVPGDDHGQASMARHAAGSWSRPHEVRSHECRVRTLDDYCRESGAAPSFVKCDVEGAELLVLRGGAVTLAACRPLLHLEVNPDWTRSLGYAPPEIVRFLAGLGYSRFLLVEQAVRPLGDPEAAIAALAELAGSANLLCAVAGLHDARLSRLERRA
jgi:FkbM family methyltransferase